MELKTALNDYRTDTGIRRLVSTLLSEENFVESTQAATGVNFKIAGSLLDNTASTLTFPDLDLLAQCSLIGHAKGFKLEPNKNAQGYFRVKLIGRDGRKIVDSLKKNFIEHFNPEFHNQYVNEFLISYTVELRFSHKLQFSHVMPAEHLLNKPLHLTLDLVTTLIKSTFFSPNKCD